MEAYAELFGRARSAGLGLTIHTGETPLTGARGMLAVLERWRPSRIGHGIAAAGSEEAMRKLVERKTVLELCPSSNLRTRVVSGLEELGRIMSTFLERSVPFTINTDGPYLLDTHLRQEFEMLLAAGVLTEAQALHCVETARGATFVG